jgi:tetratricopeptide (TPR) repeat protein
VRDDDGQKAFSKLRSSQAGVYLWRCAFPGQQPPCPPEFQQKTPASKEALLRETEFAFKQAFAFCPYSPEAVDRYVNFLLGMAQQEAMSGQVDKAAHHFDDAILVGQTCQKLDPYNEQIAGLVKTVQGYKAQITGNAQALAQAAGQLKTMEETARTNPADVNNLVNLGINYIRMQQNGPAGAVLDKALDRPELTIDQAKQIANGFLQLQDATHLDKVERRIVALAPNDPEARCDLAALEAMTGRSTEALADLKSALDLSAARQAKDPNARNLLEATRTDNRFAGIRNLPEFQKLVPPK